MHTRFPFFSSPTSYPQRVEETKENLHAPLNIKGNKQQSRCGQKRVQSRAKQTFPHNQTKQQKAFHTVHSLL